MQAPVFTNAKLKPKLFGDRTYLISFALRFVHSDYFLQSHNVGASLLYYIDDPLGSYTAIKTAALMNVVSCDSERRHGNRTLRRWIILVEPIEPTTTFIFK
jgi:hypothetical protein